MYRSYSSSYTSRDCIRGSLRGEHEIACAAFCRMAIPLYIVRVMHITNFYATLYSALETL